MGLGRREFVRLMSIAVAGLAIDPLQAVATHENLYVNKKLGVLFYIPKGWGFIAVKAYGRLKKGQILANERKRNREKAWQDVEEPVFLATKYYEDKPEYIGVFSPTIMLFATPKEEVDYLEVDSFEELVDMSALGAAYHLKKLKVTKRHEPFFISNTRFFEYDAEYLFEHEEIKGPLKVELKLLAAEHNGYHYFFNLHQSKAQNQVADQEFEDFKKTIKLI